MICRLSIRPRLLVGLLLLSRAVILMVAGGLAVNAAPADISLTEARRYTDLFRPWTTENVALSPDGALIAYSRRIDEALWVTVVEADDPTVVRSQVQVGSDTASTPVLEVQSLEKIPVRIDWMGWATADRLVVQTNEIGLYSIARRPDGASNDPLIDPDTPLIERVQVAGRIYAFDADGSNDAVLATPEQVGRLDDSIPVHRRTITNSLPDVANFFNEEGSAFANARTTLDPSPSDPSTPPPLAVIPQVPAVVDFSPDDERHIWVRAGTAEDFDLYSIDVFNGRKRMLRTERVTVGRTALVDRQQKIRIALPSTTATAFPHRYLYDTGRLLLPWKPLQEQVDDAVQTDFSLHPGNILGGRSFPLGFDENPDLLYFASDMERNTFGIYALQLSTGRLTDVAVEHPLFDVAPPNFYEFAGPRHMIYDRFSRRLLGFRYHAANRTTAWLRSDWRALQDQLEALFPNRSVDILEWDQNVRRFLVRVEGPSDPGSFHLYDAQSGSMKEFAQVAPALEAMDDAWTVSFVFERPGADNTLGRLTVPHRPVVQPTPVIILCPENFWDRLSPDFDRRATALARMGFVVAQFDGRGTWGLGRAHRRVIQEGYEDAQARDIVAFVDFLEERFAVDPTRVALMGEGLGGFLALRTLQEFPDRFRGAIAINAPFDLRSWFEKARWGGSDDRPAPEASVELVVPWLGDREQLSRAPLVSAPGTIAKPVQLFAFRSQDGDSLTPDYNHAFTLARTLRRQNIPVELVDLHRDYLRGLPEAQARVHAQMAGFLNTHLFDYSVDMEEMEVELEIDRE